MNTDALRACEARVCAQTRIIGVHLCASVVSNNLTVLSLMRYPTLLDSNEMRSRSQR
jgi:hypothetical protein